MNVKKSFFNLKIFTQNLFKFLPLLMFFMVIQLLISIGVLKSLTYELSYISDHITINNEYITTYFTRTVTGPGNQVMMAIYTLCCGISLFHYMFQPKICKTIHSLPVTRFTMFTTNILSGLVMIAAPFILTNILSGLYLVINGFSFLCIFPSLGIQLAYSFIFLCISILAVMLTGHIVAVPVMYGFLNFGFFISENLCMMVICNFFYGLSDGPETMGHTVLTPFVYLMSYLKVNYETSKFYRRGFYALAIYCVVGLILLVLSYILYKKRMLENQGSPIAAKKLEPIFHYSATLISSVLFTIIITAILTLSNGKSYLSTINIAQMIVIFLITSIIAFYIIKMLFNKTIRVFSTLNRGLIVYLGVSILVFISAIFDVYGIESRIPDINNIKSVEITHSGSLPLTLKDPQHISDFIKIHKDFINAKSEVIANDGYMSHDFSNYFTISYTLKNGKTVKRHYSYCFNANDTSNANKKIKAIDNKICGLINNSEIIYDTISSLKNIYQLQLYSIEPLEDNGFEYDENLYSFDKKDFHTIINALKKDAKNGNIIYNDFTGSTVAPDSKYELDIYSDQLEYSSIELILSPEAEYTLEALKECGALDSDGKVIYKPDSK